jgi:hypothetical protein
MSDERWPGTAGASVAGVGRAENSSTVGEQEVLMGNAEFILEMSARPGSGDPVSLQRELWRMLRATIGHWIKSDELRDIAAYLEALPAEPDWSANLYELNFSFPEDVAGAEVAVRHWLELSVGAEWSRVCRRAERHGFTVTSSRPPLWPEDHFVTLQDALWWLPEGPNSTALSRGAHRLPLTELSIAEQAIVSTAKAECGCQPCKILRPDPAMAQTLVRLLEESVEARETVQWYLSRARSLPAVMAEAIGRICEIEPTRAWGLIDAVQRVATWGSTLRMSGYGAGPTTVRLAWLSGGGILPESDIPVDVVQLLKGAAPLCALAAEVAAERCYADPGPAAAELIGILKRERDPRVRYHAVRALSSLYLVAREMPRDVEEALRSEAAHPDSRSDSAALARVVVDHLNGANPVGW